MDVIVGYQVGTGEQVCVPLRHMAVTGQTQESGKTTTLEAMTARLGPGTKALAFVTKRGESAFTAARRIQPYFHDRADWQFVTSLLDATLQEKNKFLRPWIMKICRTTRTLADVQREVRKALRTAKGLNEGVYTQLDAYLELIVPEIQRAKLAPVLDLRDGMNVMDISAFATPMQMLFVQSAIDWVNERQADTVVIVPEAWEFIPQSKSSPVKHSAETLVRKGAGLRNLIWIDSQDMAGVDNMILRGCPVWLIGVQREANEIKRTLANIPKSIKRPTAADIAELERGQFFVCWGKSAVKTYVRPAWMPANEAIAVARGILPTPSAPIQLRQTIAEDPTVTENEARELREENERLRLRIAALERQAPSSNDQASADVPRSGRRDNGDVGSTPIGADALYQQFKARLIEELPKDARVLQIILQKPELRVEVERKIVTVDGAKPTGRIARLIAAGWFDEGKTQGATRKELARTGSDVNSGNISTIFTGLVKDGFLTAEADNLYRAVEGMKINIVER